MHDVDVVVIGAGAAGLFCAGQAGQLGLRVLLLDHNTQVAEKVRISGGGRCNFTNRDLDVRAPQRHFISDNPNFCRSALSRYTPQAFMTLLQGHGVAFHEKHQGQLFCDHSAQDVIDLLLGLCDAGQVTRWQPCSVKQIRYQGSAQPGHTDTPIGYEIDTDRGLLRCRSLVVACGGLSIPKIGASDFGYRIAQQFGLRLVPTRPALVPLTFDASQWAGFAELAGLSLPVHISVLGSGKQPAVAFLEDLLFTHRGLSGPAVLQISSYWRDGLPLRINLAPGVDLAQSLADTKLRSRKLIANVLSTWLPARLAEAWVCQNPAWQRPIHEATDRALRALADSLHDWRITPSGTEGYRKAEVTAGGVDTRDLSSQTMEAQAQPGLYFIGEVVDVTGWLGGYNFQWAWASAHACAQALAARLRPAQAPAVASPTVADPILRASTISAD